MQNGSLLRYIRKQEKSETLAQYLTVRFGYQIALGMAHVANMGVSISLYQWLFKYRNICFFQIHSVGVSWCVGLV